MNVNPQPIPIILKMLEDFKKIPIGYHIINLKEESTNCYGITLKDSTVFSVRLNQKRSKVIYNFFFCLESDLKQIITNPDSGKTYFKSSFFN